MTDVLRAAGELEAPASRTAGPREAVPAGMRVTTIVPAGRWPSIDWRELWEYRGLFLFLVWRDIKVRYAQTVLGAGWAVLQPVLTMVVFSLIFGRLARIPTGGVPYPAFSLAALVPWTYFSSSVTAASQSLVASQNLITKAYLPRLVVPCAPVLAALLDFLIASAVLLAVLLFYGLVPPPSAIVLVPLLMVPAVLTAAGLGAWLAALEVRYRDVKYVVPFLIQALMYLSPIVYPSSLVPPAYRTVYALNPMAGVIAGFRSVLLGRDPMPWDVVGVSTAAALVVFAGGLLYFRAVERTLADVA